MTGKVPHKNLAYYINTKTLEAIHQNLGIPLSKTISGSEMNGVRTSMDDEEDGEEVEEDVIDEYNEDQSVC